MSVQALSTTTYLDLPLDDVCAGAAFFRRMLALPVHLLDRDRADVELGPGLVAQLRTAPPRTGITVRRTAGPILQLQVPDLIGAVAELRRRGATVLIEPVRTDWGTDSAFIAGPDDVIIEVYRPQQD